MWGLVYNKVPENFDQLLKHPMPNQLCFVPETAVFWEVHAELKSKSNEQNSADFNLSWEALCFSVHYLTRQMCPKVSRIAHIYTRVINVHRVIVPLKTRLAYHSSKQRHLGWPFVVFRIYSKSISITNINEMSECIRKTSNFNIRDNQENMYWVQFYVDVFENQRQRFSCSGLSVG